MTMSPIYGGAIRDLPRRWLRTSKSGAAGNDSTLVGVFLPRQSRLSARIVESLLSTIASSAGAVEAALAAARTAFLTTDRAVRRLFHNAERTMTSSFTVPVRLNAGHSIFGSPPARGIGLVVGRDDPRHQLMADHVRGAECRVADPLDIFQELRRFREAGHLSGRQVDLARIAGDDHAAVLAQAGEKHFHLHRRGVLRLVENDHRVGQCA